MIFCSKIKIDSIKQTKVPFLHQLIASWPTSGPPGGKWWLCLLEHSLHPLLLQQEQRKAQIILTLRKIFYIILILATISSLDKTDPGVISSSYTSYGMGDCLTLCSRLTEVVFTLTFHILHPVDLCCTLWLCVPDEGEEVVSTSYSSSHCILCTSKCCR